jgi:hypothetical protein
MSKKPQDATLRNIRAAKKREQAIEAALKQRIKMVDLTLAGWILDLQNRVEQLEARNRT